MTLILRSVLNIGRCNKLQRFYEPITKCSSRSFQHRRPGIKIITPETRNFSVLIRPFLFTSLASASCFACCAIWQYEYLREQLKNSNKKIFSLHDRGHEKFGVIRAHAHSIWSNLSPGKKVVASIIFTNFSVFILWRIPHFQQFMYKFFTATPFSGATSLSLLGSMFSHVSLPHFCVNMYALWSFSDPIIRIFGKEQFVALYISGGLISGFTSYFYKFIVGSTMPSLGASGAVLAVVGAVASQFPNSQVSIMLIDQIFPHSFSASTAVGALIAIDCVGMLARWKFIDHAAHLGGVLFGIWYLKFGHKIIWGNRESFLQWWHNKRGKL